MKTIKVCCAVIFWDEKVFAAQRSDDKTLPGYWEFPGGKVEQGEAIFDCISREMNEELAMIVRPSHVLPEVFYDYGDFCIELYPVMCDVDSSDFSLNEHKNAGWFDIERLNSLKWAPADLPIVRLIVQGDI
ncbi:(deoxy)nucleoside triphosphate pyrophosphohydrolase [Methylophaga sp.]|uniref:(deoxy)nucleoside triphosphate pyrophosphohydrolase n=1 Tax=Methylophaga sp. TaxID=2024840 RepID=UPI003A912F0E